MHHHVRDRLLIACLLCYGRSCSCTYNVAWCLILASKTNVEHPHNRATNRGGCQQVGLGIYGQVGDGCLMRTNGAQHLELDAIEQHHSSGILRFGIRNQTLGRAGESANSWNTQHQCTTTQRNAMHMSNRWMGAWISGMMQAN
jgi:hypothetical protein